MTVEEVLYLHYRLISRTGGRHGVRAPALLASAVARPFARVRGQDVYPTPFDKAGILLFGLIANRCFRDGNEMLAVAAAVLLLHRFGWRLEKTAGLPALVAAVAAGTCDWRGVSAWLRENGRPLAEVAAGAPAETGNGVR
ncbi:MAG: Fic family protein [Thermoanaerobacteraceae bacterium]|jgi:death-on-curing protein|nr:Fic family protein [Thermoanaerobacteraceae bacterium]